MPFQFDVFISYSSTDRDWASAVNGALSARGAGYKTFFDANSLRAGDDWEDHIQGALETSRHLVVLWSDHAKQSDWVTRELWTFFTTAKPRSNAERRLIVVNLQGMNQATKAFQQISRPDIQSAYPVIGNVSAAVWDEVRQTIEGGLDPQRRLVEVPLVVLTATLQQLQELPVERRHWLEADFGISEAQLYAHYGNTRNDWHPFAGDKPITQILEDLRKHNMSVAHYTFQWRQPDDSYWEQMSAARDFVNKEFKTAELGVLLIDSVAIYHPDIYQRLMLFQDSLASEKATIITLPPFEAPQSLVGLRNALLNRGVPYFDDYFQPHVPPVHRIAAQCGWNVVDAEDIRRLFLAAAGRLWADTGAVPSTPFTRQG